MVGAGQAAWGGVAGQPEEVVAFVQGQAQAAGEGRGHLFGGLRAAASTGSDVGVAGQVLGGGKQGGQRAELGPLLGDEAVAEAGEGGLEAADVPVQGGGGHAGVCAQGPHGLPASVRRRCSSTVNSRLASLDCP
jgi:hypothetical protein